MKPLTTKQRALLKIVVMGNLDGKGNRVSDVDYTQILDRLPYRTSRDSLMCSMRILVQQGWVSRGGKELRDGRMKQTVVPSADAIRVETTRASSLRSGVMDLEEPEYLEIDLDDDVVVFELPEVDEL